MPDTSRIQRLRGGRIRYRGRVFPGFNKPIRSSKANKKIMVLAKKGRQFRLVHAGQKGYRHNYSPAAKRNYLTRSRGIRNKFGQLTKDDKFSPNYWARRHLWPRNQKTTAEKRAASRRRAKMSRFNKRIASFGSRDVR
ncbi:MAG TPA: hypothetical protein V6D33_08940 [Cyanophyceae cyanobacterium]